jgi:hypothetical protein
MNLLSYFKWYRRARGGYWAQVTGLIFGKRWVRCPERGQPTPDNIWEFYPWAKKQMGNGYIDEWHIIEPIHAVPVSTITIKAINGLKLAINTVECDSTDKDGNELPWYKNAKAIIKEFEGEAKL